MIHFFGVTVRRCIYDVRCGNLNENCIPLLRKICVKSSKSQEVVDSHEILLSFDEVVPFNTRLHGSPLFVGESL